MPAKDIYHEMVKRALTKDGWTITHDPLKLKMGRRTLYVDLGAEKDGQKLGVEIKSFTGLSEIHNLEHAAGQYALYQDILQLKDPARTVVVAVRHTTFDGIFSEPIGKLVIANRRIQLLVIEEFKIEVMRWIP